MNDLTVKKYSNQKKMIRKIAGNLCLEWNFLIKIMEIYHTKIFAAVHSYLNAIFHAFAFDFSIKPNIWLKTIHSPSSK